MNKFILLLAGIVAAAFAPGAFALPAFARQTGMECAACHFQHFPLLTAFGRSFKSGAYTLMGTQGKVEGDHLSIPVTLNLAVLTTFGYEKTNQAPGVPSIGTLNPGNGQFYVPANGGELSLFYGGRVSDNAGFLAELGATGPAATGSAKLPVLFEVADATRAGIVPFTTVAQGASYGFELLNTGANAVHQMSPAGGMNNAHTNAISAQQYIGTGGGATGVTFVIDNPGYFVNLTKVNQTVPGNADAGIASNLGSSYARVAAMFDLAGWDTGVGIQNWGGSSYRSAAKAQVVTKATAVDGQMQGTLGNMTTGIYVTYARAPYEAAVANVYDMGGTLTRSSFNVAAELGVLPGVATIGAAIRRGNSGVDAGTGSNATDNATMLTVTYKLAQNMMASFTYTRNSGSYWDQVNPDTKINPGGLTNTYLIGSRTTTINVFTLF
jgi:hypothetical protein